MKKFFALVMSVIMILASGGIAGAEQEVRLMETASDADEWVSVFLGEHPEELDGIWAMTAQMEAAVTGMGGIGGLAKQFEKLGPVEKTDPAREGELQGYKVFLVRDCQPVPTAAAEKRKRIQILLTALNCPCRFRNSENCPAS